MRTLVTGGAGFIGSHVVRTLLQAGHHVVVADDLSRGKRANVPEDAHLVTIDIATEAADELVAENKPQAIFHLAAQMDVRASVQDPLFDARVNVLGTLRLLQAAARHNVETFIFASTGGAIYGEQTTFPADESHACRPTSPYGQSKLSAEGYLDYFGRLGALRTVALRFANVFGPRQDPHGEAGVVAIFAGKMLAGETPTIYGDGRQTRDYVFVGDVVAANMLALERREARGAYNIGTGVETDVNSLAATIARASQFTGKPHYAPARPGEQTRSVIDAARAKRELGWQPRVDLAEGLRQTVAWFAQKSSSERGDPT